MVITLVVVIATTLLLLVAVTSGIDGDGSNVGDVEDEGGNCDGNES